MLTVMSLKFACHILEMERFLPAFWRPSWRLEYGNITAVGCKQGSFRCQYSDRCDVD